MSTICVSTHHRYEPQPLHCELVIQESCALAPQPTSRDDRPHHTSTGELLHSCSLSVLCATHACTYESGAQCRHHDVQSASDVNHVLSGVGVQESVSSREDSAICS